MYRKQSAWLGVVLSHCVTYSSPGGSHIASCTCIDATPNYCKYAEDPVLHLFSYEVSALLFHQYYNLCCRPSTTHEVSALLYHQHYM